MRILFLFTTLLLNVTLYAQNSQPAFNTGTKFDYALDFNGQNLEYDLTLKSTVAPLVLEWNVPTYGTGTYQLSQKGLQSGTMLNFDQVSPGSATQLKDNETVIMISKDSFSSLQKNGTFSYTGATFSKKPEASPLVISVKGKPLDLIHVATADGVTELWILNNPDFPLIAKIKGNPLNVNYTLTHIEN